MCKLLSIHHNCFTVFFFVVVVVLLNKTSLALKFQNGSNLRFSTSSTMKVTIKIKLPGQVSLRY